MSYKLPGLSQSEGQQVFEPVPPGEYLLKVTGISTTNKEENGTITGITFTVDSIVENAENLPAGEDKGNVIGRTVKDWIFVMSPEHEKYNQETKFGGIVGMIGIDNLKSFLMAAGVPVKGDSFNEQVAIGHFFEAKIGLREYTPKGSTEKKVGNEILIYRKAEDVGGPEVSDDADVPDDFEGDLE